MVRDVAEGNAVHVLETFWHFDPSLALHQIDGAWVAASVADEELTEGIAFVPVKDKQWDCRTTSGRISPVYGVAEPAEVLRCRAEIKLPAEHAIVVRALTGKGDVPGQLVRLNQKSAVANGISAYEYSENGRAHCLIFKRQAATVWKFGDWESDAEFLYYCAEDHRISQMTLCKASVLKYQGEALISASREGERFEYWEREGKRQTSSSDHEILHSFPNTKLASSDAGVVR